MKRSMKRNAQNKNKKERRLAQVWVTERMQNL